MKSDIQPILVCDTREPQGAGWEPLFTVPTIRGTLQTGDYSLLGAEQLISIERKSLPDLLGSLTHDRARFERELSRARAFDFFAVIVEASAGDVLKGRYGRFGKGCNPQAIWESCAAFSVRYAPFIFAENRYTAAKMCQSLLMKWAREHVKTVEAIEAATRGAKAIG